MNEAAVLLEPDNRRFRWVGRLARSRNSEPPLDDVAEALAAEARARRGERTRLRDRRAPLAISLGYLFTAVTLAAVVDTSRAPSFWTAALLVLTYAIAARVGLEVGAGSAVPTELVLVPMLFVLPLGQVPLWVALAILLGEAPDLARTWSAERALVILCGSWSSVGPVLVLAVAGEQSPTWGDLPVYLIALATQFAVGFGSAALRHRLAHDMNVLGRYLRWVFLVDTMLAPIGLAIAFAAAASPAAVLLALPLIALLAFFARERKVRIDHALELSGAYRGTGLLAETYHEILGEGSLERALERIVDTISTLIEVDGARVVSRRRVDVPGVALFERGERAAGTAAVHRLELPMVARGRSEGMFSVWRDAEVGAFDGDECRLVAWFADAAALALDNARARTALERRAESDSLTRLLNHRAFHERLRNELSNIRGGVGTTALLLLDIDDFKRINDVHGHAIGDMVLTKIAGILRSTVRAEDHACRIGGEEFAVIIPSGNATGATALARRIAGELANSDLEPVGEITVSIGVAEAPRHATSARELAVCADTAMLTAKAGGKDRAVVFDPDAGERRAPTGRREDVSSVADVLARLREELGTTLDPTVVQALVKVLGRPAPR
jgi:diguanylate cyclase (GGDEF)-like protein